MILSIAVPSKTSFAEKDSLAKMLHEAKLGCFLSDLPQNHELDAKISKYTSYWNSNNKSTNI